MSIPNKDELKGKFRRAKGSVKEKVGRATKDPRMIRESQSESRRTTNPPVELKKPSDGCAEKSATP